MTGRADVKITGGPTQNTAAVDSYGREAFNTTFGDRIVATRIPMISAQFQYPLQSGDATTTTANGGSVSYDQSMLVLSTGTGATGTASVQSIENVRYIPGHEVYANFTVAFLNAGNTGSEACLGLYDGSDGFYLCYAGAVLALRRVRAGVIEDTVPIDFAALGIDPTKLNIYRMTYGFLGAAPCSLSVMKPDGTWIRAARINYPGTSIYTHLTQTFLPARVVVKKTGGASNLTVRIGSIEAGIINGGKEDSTGRRFSQSLGSRAVLANTETVLGTFRNLTTFAGIPNKIPAKLMLVSCAAEGTKPVSFRLLRNPTFTNTPTFTPVSLNNSTLEVSSDATINPATGTLFVGWELAKSDNFFQDMMSFDFLLNPSDWACFTAKSTGATDISMSIRWIELF